jgi:hypothetical protein
MSQSASLTFHSHITQREKSLKLCFQFFLSLSIMTGRGMTVKIHSFLCVGHKTDADNVAKNNICPCWESNPDFQPMASYFNNFASLFRLINMHRSGNAEHSECSKWQHLFVYTCFTTESMAETVQVQSMQ